MARAPPLATALDPEGNSDEPTRTLHLGSRRAAVGCTTPRRRQRADPRGESQRYGTPVRRQGPVGLAGEPDRPAAPGEERPGRRAEPVQDRRQPGLLARE